MSEKAQQLKEMLQLMMHRDITVSATVDSVDEGAFTCSVTLANGMKIIDAQLKALKKAPKGAVLIPVMGSTVQLLSLDGEWLVISVEEVDKVYIDATTSIIINGGNNGGVPIGSKISDNLTALRNYIKQILEPAIAAGLTAVGVGSAANGGTGSSTFTNQLAGKDIQINNMENNNVKH